MHRQPCLEVFTAYERPQGTSFIFNALFVCMARPEVDAAGLTMLPPRPGNKPSACSLKRLPHLVGIAVTSLMFTDEEYESPIIATPTPAPCDLGCCCCDFYA